MTRHAINIRNEKGRYIRYGKDQEEFYDTKQDPHEWTNLIHHPEYRSIINKMQTMVLKGRELATPLPQLLN